MILRRFTDKELLAELAARGVSAPRSGVETVYAERYVNLYETKRDGVFLRRSHEDAARDAFAMLFDPMLKRGALRIEVIEELSPALKATVRVLFDVAVPPQAVPDPAPIPAPTDDGCFLRLWQDGRAALDDFCQKCGSRSRHNCPNPPPRPAPVEDRPAHCRDRLAAEGKPHPKSGCAVAGCRGVFGPSCGRGARNL